LILIIGAVKQAWEGNLFGLRDTIKKWAGGLKEVFGKVFRWLKDAWNKVTSSITDTVLYAYGYLTGKTPEETEKLVKAFSDSFEIGAGEELSAIWDGAKEGVAQVGADLKSVFMDGVGVLMDGLDAARDKLGLMKGETVAAKAPSVSTGGAAGGVRDVGIQSAGVDAFVESRARERDLKDTLAESAIKNQEAQMEYAAGAAAGVAVQSFGKLGDVFEQTAQGFAQGGLFGGIIAFIGSILQEAPGFTLLLSEMGALFGDLITAFEPVLSAIIGVVRVIGVMLKPAFEMIGQSLQVLRPTLVFLFNVLKGVAKIALTIFGKLASAWNWMIEGIAKLVGKIKDSWGKTIRKAKINTDGIEDAKKALDEIEFGETADAVDKMADSADKATRALLNLPSGYKIDRARFGATAAEGPRIGNQLSSAGGGTSVAIDTVVVQANNPEEFERAMSTREGWNNYNRTGTTQRTGGPYSNRTQVK
jgi:hypothetical protein